MDARTKQLLELNGSRITALYASGQVAEGLASAQSLLSKRARSLVNAISIPLTPEEPRDRVFASRPRHRRDPGIQNRHSHSDSRVTGER